MFDAKPIGEDFMKTVFSKDLYRYYGDGGESLGRRMLRPPELRYIALFRRANTCRFRLLRLYYTVRLKLLSYKTQIQIPARTEIGEGFYIGHSGRVIVNPEAKLGKNMNVSTGVVIGAENRGARKGAPTFDGYCWIGANAVIVGNVHIGEDVLIAPLAYVNFDVPPHSIVIGNPAKIIHKENATSEYICNTI
jgi:serine O-acetyltransferase